MKIKLTTHPFLILATLFATFLASCSTSNKVVSSFGKRKYTKGYYFASAGRAKAVLPIRNSTARIISSVPSQTVNIFATDETNTIVASLSPVLYIQQKRTKLSPAIVATKTNKANISSVPFIFREHDAADNNLDQPNAWDIIAIAALILSLLAVPLLVEGYLLSQVYAVAYTTARAGKFLFDAGWLSILLAIILGLIGYAKSTKHHALAVYAIYIACGVLIAGLLLFFLIFPLFFFT